MHGTVRLYSERLSRLVVALRRPSGGTECARVLLPRGNTRAERVKSLDKDLKDTKEYRNSEAARADR